MRKFIEAVTLNENVIRLGSNPNKEKLTAFMAEFTERTHDHPLDSRSRLTNNASLTVYPFDGAIHLSDVQALQPRSGGGTQAMKLICQLADKHNVKVSLTAKAYSEGRMSTQQLKSWYEGFGFHEDEDSFGDEEEGFDMTRWPNAS